MSDMPLPFVIQGGMGAGVSGWPLARAVSAAGQLGVVAGTALDVILARRLQNGDPGGAMRRALARLPVPGVARRIVEHYHVPGGKPRSAPFRALPPFEAPLAREREELIVAASFAEVHLAKEGHGSPVGINFLEKIQLPTLPSLFGAMLAGVDFVLVGAGLPLALPGVLDELARWRPVELALEVRGAHAAEPHRLRFDPNGYRPSGPASARALDRPYFLGIVSSKAAASALLRRATGRVDGWVVEGPSAGGHNAPPRGAARTGAEGELVFGERDLVDLEALASLGLPFWVAGAQASPDRLAEALGRGAAGVQVGTAFAFCRESGLESRLKRRVQAEVRAGTVRVVTDPLASPTGFPFKVLSLSGTASEAEVFDARRKVCDLGYLRHAYLRADGSVGWRCPGEPERSWLRKGGEAAQVHGRKCVCNGLMANIGLGQRRRDGASEEPLLTCGSDTGVVAQLLERCGGGYTARDVVEHLLEGLAAGTAPS